MATLIPELVNKHVSVQDIRRTFKEQHTVTIDDFLEEQWAERAGQSLDLVRSEFSLLSCKGDTTSRLDVKPGAPGLLHSLLKAQLATARSQGSFTYLYYQWTPHPGCSDHSICQVTDWLRSPSCWSFIDTCTGVTVSSTVVVGVTSYARGHYLDRHTDHLEQDNFQRRIAFTLSFSQHWEPSMGGLLTIINPDGTENALVPRFNSLTLMDIEKGYSHYVSPVETDQRERITLVGFFCTPASSTL